MLILEIMALPDMQEDERPSFEAMFHSEENPINPMISLHGITLDCGFHTLTKEAQADDGTATKIPCGVAFEFNPRVPMFVRVREAGNIETIRNMLHHISDGKPNHGFVFSASDSEDSESVLTLIFSANIIDVHEAEVSSSESVFRFVLDIHSGAPKHKPVKKD